MAIIGAISSLIVWGLLIRLIYFAIKGKDWRTAGKQFGIGLLIMVALTGIGGVLTAPQTPEEKAAHEKKMQDMKEKREREEKERAEKKAIEDQQRVAREKQEEEKRKEKMKEEYKKEQKIKEDAKRAQFEKDRYTGWNKADEFPADDNMSKGFELIRDYRYIIETTPAETVPFSQVAAAPWEYYGKILHLTGYLTQLEQAPPENSVAKAFGGKYSYGTVVINDDVVWFHVLNSRSDIEKNGPIFKGFFLGKGKSENMYGGSVQGLKFVGILEKDVP